MHTHTPRRWLAPLAITFMSILCALIALTAALMVLPDRLIGPAQWSARTSANQRMTVTWKPSDGDVYAALAGQVRPPPDDSPYHSFEIAWDADGFRTEAVPHTTHPVAVFGDSFTEGFNVQYPYADRLAEKLKIGVKNYGYRAYGPVEVAEAATEFIADSPRDWVIWGYFSGNDLGDALREPRIDTSNPLAVWKAFIDKARPPMPPHTPARDENGEPRYNQPVPVIIGANYYDMAFVSYYGWWQQTPPDADRSRNAARVIDTLGAIDAAADARTCRAVAFIPPKELIYARYIYPSERTFMNAANQRIMLRGDGMLVFTPSPVSQENEEAYFASLYAHRDLIQSLVQGRAGWRFIDLTPAFEAAAAEGMLLYYPYDTHWTQAGHDLAAETIAAAIEGGC